MKSLPIIAIAVFGGASACSVQDKTVQRPAPPPAPGATAVVSDPVQPPRAPVATNNPGTMVLNNFDPPMRIEVSR